MPTTVALRHRTTYRYGDPVTLGPQTIRLRPPPLTRATIRNYALTVLPCPSTQRWFRDASGNLVAQLAFEAPTDTLDLAVTLDAELGDVNPFDFVLDPEAATWPFAYPAPLAHDLVAYQALQPIRPFLATLLADIPLQAQSSVQLLTALNQLVFRRISYITRLEPGVLSPEQTVGSGAGSCRDVAWLLVAIARSLGFAARFVSGYLIQLADAASLAPALAADTADLHAWAEIYLPGAGWLGFDATSGLSTGAGHIPLAASAHPDGAAPVTGTIGASGATGFDVEMTVTRLPVSPASSSATPPTAADRQ